MLSGFIKYPLAPIAAVFAAGIGLGEWLGAPRGWLLAATVFYAGAAWWHERWRSRLLWILVFLAGWTHLVFHSTPASPRDLRLVAGEAIQEAVVEGVLDDEPTLKQFGEAGAPEFYSSAVVNVARVQLGREAWAPASGQVMATVSEALPDTYFAGRRVRISGLLQPPNRAAVPGLFDYATYLRQRGIYHQLRTRNGAEWILTEPDRRPPLSARFQIWARRILALGLPENDEVRPVIWAMLLGWRTGLTDEVSAPFMRSGTMHLFAISGLHIAMLSGALVMLMRLISLPKRAAAIATLPLIWFYIAATGWQASAIRAGIMITVVLAGWILHRPANLLNSLFASAVIILAWDPRQLFQASFQLSFMVVLAIALWEPLWRRFWEAVFQRDDFLPASQEPWPRPWLRQAGGWLAHSTGVSVVASLGSVPLIAHYFSLFTPVCVLANLVIVPISGLVLAAGLGSLLTGAWCPPLAELFNHSAWGVMKFMMWASEGFAGWPGSYWHVPTLPAWGLAIYYLILVTAATPGMNGWRRRAGLAALAVMTAGWLFGAPRLKPPTLAVLPVEDGHAVFLNQFDGNYLVDCGRPAPAQRIIEPFLHAQGVNCLNGLLLTHGDIGQMGGADFIRTNFHPQHVYGGALNFRSPIYRALMEQYAAAPGFWRPLPAGENLKGWRVLHPAADDAFAVADDGALVLKHESPSGSCLLLSDLGRTGQNALTARWTGRDLQADIIITGMPSGEEPVAEGLLRLTRPRLIVVADAMYPAEQRAPTNLQRRLARHRTRVLYTRLCGAVTIEFTASGWRARAMNGEVMDSRELPPYAAPMPSPEREEH